METNPLAPRPATFLDYVPPAPITTPVGRNLYPIVENSASPVANQLVQTVSNEAIFQAGAAPRAPTVLYRAPVGADAPPQLRSGPFLFHTGISIENYFNDNFFGSTRDERSSWLRNYTPTFSLNYQPTKNVAVDTFYNFTMHDYSTSVSRDYYDENAGIAIRFAHFGVEGLTFNIGNIYNQIGTTIVNPLADQFDLANLEFKTGARFATNALPMQLSYAGGPVRLEAGYTYGVTDYFDPLNSPNDAQQHTVVLRGSYDIVPQHFNFFGEYSFNHTGYPSAGEKDFNFQHVFAGIKGRYENLSYQLKTGYSFFDPLETGIVTARPLLAADVGYIYSPRLDFSLFGNRTLEAGVLTNQRLTDSYGAAVNIHPMMRGVLGLTHVWQSQNGSTTSNTIQSSTLSYKHRILNLIEPRLGVKYADETFQDAGGDTQDIIWTGSAGIGFNVNPRTAANLDYYHEDSQRSDRSKRITDRLTAVFAYKINFFSTATLGYDHAYRRNTTSGTVRINELRVNFNLTW